MKKVEEKESLSILSIDLSFNNEVYNKNYLGQSDVNKSHNDIKISSYVSNKRKINKEDMKLGILLFKHTEY